MSPCPGASCSTLFLSLAVPCCVPQAMFDKFMAQAVNRFILQCCGLLVWVFAHLSPVGRLLGCLCSSERPGWVAFVCFQRAAKSAAQPEPSMSLHHHLSPQSISCVSCSLWKPPLKPSARGMVTCHIPKRYLDKDQGEPRCSKASLVSDYGNAAPCLLPDPCAVHELY